MTVALPDLAGSPISDQETWPLAAEVGPQALARGERGLVVVTLEVPEGSHVQAHDPLEPFLIPTDLHLGEVDGLSFGGAVYPQAEEERFDWTPVVLRVYRGQVQIAASVTAEIDAVPGRRTISGRIRYQGCIDTICLPPAERTVEAVVDVI